MRALLVSTYELGHQPLHVASPAAALLGAGHEVRCLDLSVEPWDPEVVAWADAVALSVPMHTAMRLATRVAGAVRAARPDLPICLYGLYAPVARDHTVGRLADRVVAGEYETALVEWFAAVAGGARPVDDPDATVVHLGRGGFRLPARHLLPPLDRYAHLAVGGEERPVGYVEASHGCTFRCRHCPVPTVYDGRLRIVGADVVLADIEQLVAAGARHITFGDPDFLNGVHHSLRIVEAVHDRFPDLTFDCTTKVELILRHDSVWGAMADAGCLFVTSALESVNDAVLTHLDKGHTSADAARAVHLLREHGIELRPSFLPFTPWTTVDDLVALVDFVARHDLVANVDPVQYTIRLLLPDGSLLLDHPDVAARITGYDAEHLTWGWRGDPDADALQERLAALVEERTAAGEAIGETYAAVRALVHAVAGTVDMAPVAVEAGSTEGRPRLTEPWFC